MNRQDAETTVAGYMKPIYGFALKRCGSREDAEDLAQEIVLKAFRMLLLKDDIADTGKYIWTVAHNALNNYYRNRARSSVAVPIDEMAETLADPDTLLQTEEERAPIERLRAEIAYLAKTQRRIVIAYYFENKKQQDIAAELGIPLGTVKWHLFEAKKDLKKGMETMRQASDLKFNPIRFENYGINGSIGTKSLDSFFRSALVQNICYCVRNEAKTVGEIADALGVSPVYVEGEAEHLEEYGYLKKEKDKYTVNFLLTEPTAELLTMQDAMYKKAAAPFAADLYDALTESGLLDDPRIICGQTDASLTAETPRADRNFLLWSLIPYIAANAGEEKTEEHISFAEAATLRPDGAHNIFNATVIPGGLTLPEDYVYMKNWCGPSWNANDYYSIWRIDTEWTERRIRVDKHEFEDMMRVLFLYAKEREASLDAVEYAWLAERGFVKTDGGSRAAWQIVILQNAAVREELIAVGTRLREKYRPLFEILKAPYEEAYLAMYPAHVRKMKAYELQHLFGADGWFLLHCMKSLLKSGKLMPPTENQRRSLTTLIVPRH